LPRTAGQIQPVVRRLAVLVDGDSEGDNILSKVRGDTNLVNVPVIQLPRGWRIEKLLSEGLRTQTADRIVEKIIGSGFAKKTSYGSLCEALVDNKACLPILHVYLDVLHEEKQVPPGARCLCSGLALLCDNDDLEGTEGFEREKKGEATWRLKV
jgi:hypothetical protein